MISRVGIIVSFIAYFGYANAQSVHEVVLQWSPETLTFNSEETAYEVPTFTGAGHFDHNKFLPVYTGKFPLAKGNTATSVRIEPIEFQSDTRKTSGTPGKSNILNNIELKWVVREERGRDVVLIEYVPLASGTGTPRKISKFKLFITESGKPTARKSASYASNSVMNSGTWYRFGVVEDGLHRLDFAFLESLGINVQGISPQEINIYGNGFGQLPFENSEPRPDDLLPNAIHIEGEGDGSFDADDFILFYGKGPHKWKYNSEAQLYEHQKHDYVDTSYYFIGIGTGNLPVRITNQSSSGAAPNYDVVKFDDYIFHEVDRENLIRSGREWYGEKFDVQTTYNFTGDLFNFPNLDPTAETVVRANVISRTTVVGNCVFTLNVNGNTDSRSIPRVFTNVESIFANSADLEVRFTNAPPTLNINFTYQKNAPSAIGWLNWFTVNTRRALTMSGSQMTFRDQSSVAAGRVSRFSVGNASGIAEIWEVTSPTAPRRIQYALNGGRAEFTLPTEDLREFIAFTNSGFKTPVAFGPVPNQNLHALDAEGPIDMVIVAPGIFTAKAEELANIHRNYAPDPLTVKVVNLQQVYNEFSSGMRDVTAIKWLMKMLYDRASNNETAMPKYLLLFGDGSFDNRNSTPGNTNFIPTFQSNNSLSPVQSFVSDDYFGFLSDNEGEGNLDVMDIGVGRLVVKNNQEGTSVVNKIRRYIEVPDQVPGPNCTICNDANTNLGAWRNNITLIADDEDNNQHMRNSRTISDQITAYTQDYNLERIFIDAFQQIATPGGSRYPDVNTAIDRRVRNGAFIINYIGHGGELGWAQERILDVPTILDWDNSIAMPIFMTATCQFTRFDDPLRTSAGEYVLLNGNGGGIALLTTTRLVYSGPNFQLNQRFYDALFNRPADEIVTRLGDVSRETKNLSLSSGPNHRNFSLIGDPALPLAVPKYRVNITDITDTLNVPIDTLKALGVARVRGDVRAAGGGLLSNFNGVVTATVFDRVKTKVTLSNDGGAPFTYNTQEDVVYRGNAEVINGQFQFEFVLPKDISFAVDSTARISLYARNENEDAVGYRNGLNIGDRDPNAVDDGTGPDLELFMNDENFVFGGMTNDRPTMIARVFDNYGINTVGTGVGHDITATLDGDLSKTIILNDFYESDLNTYKSGRITYQFDKLEPGNHELKIKVWNVFNNSSETTTEFVVSDTEEFAIDRIVNYPNPFTTRTEFFFEHNQSCAFLNVKVEVYTVTGKLVKSIVTVSNTDGFRIEPIVWDGRDDFGDRLATGVYVYKVSARNPQGEQVSEFEKLVILN